MTEVKVIGWLPEDEKKKWEELPSYIVLEASPEASKTRFVDKARSVLDLR